MKQKSVLSITGMVLSSMFAALTAIGAFIEIPVPFIPFTLQILFVYFAGSLLGSRYGALSQIVYLAIGLAGVPVFTKGGGIGYVLQPTFGYLIGFLLAAFFIGKIIEKQPAPGFKHFLFAHLSGLIIVYLVGMTYLYFAMNLISGTPITLWNTFFYGFILAVPGDLVLCLAATWIAHKVYQQLSPFRQRLMNKKVEVS